MSVLVAIEGEVKKDEEWAKYLAIEETDVTGLINRCVLVQQHDGKFRLDFVGILIFRRNVVLAAPKYWPAEEKSFSRILGILRVYFSRSGRRRPVGDEHGMLIEYKDEAAFREFDALITLLSWYKDHGVYRCQRRQHGTSSGRPDWVRTLAKSIPIISAGSVVYPSPISISRQGFTNEISALQLCLLKALLDKYEVTVPHAVENDFHALASELAQHPFSDTGRFYYLAKLEKERHEVFRTDTLALLDLMIELLREMECLAGHPLVQLYGTNAFYSVWEDACRYFLCPGGDDGAIKLAQPRWSVYENGLFKQPFDGGHQRPDILTLHRGQLAIFDAKYYYPFPGSHPQWQDIVKQLYYRESITSHTDHPRINAFLFPDPSVLDFDFRGQVTVEGAGGPLFSPVEAWLVNPDLIFGNYVSGTSHNPELAFEKFFSRRKNVRELLADTNRLIGREGGDGSCCRPST